MNIVIIEDEHLAFQHMTHLIREIIPASQIVAHHDTVAGAWTWFRENPTPDLVLLDIQLSDGTAFDLLNLVNIDCPVIFTTAYDKYALDAFKTWSIDYLLKPIKKADLENSILKLRKIQNLVQLKELSKKSFPGKNDYKKRFVIRFGEHIKSLAVEDVSYFYSENKGTFARTEDGRSYPLDHNLDTLEEVLDPVSFFRINRQFIITYKAILEMKTYSKARVLIRLNPEIKEQLVVSSERANDFKKWLGGDLT